MLTHSITKHDYLVHQKVLLNILQLLCYFFSPCSAPGDYTSLIGRLLTFSATTTRQTVDVSITEDAVNEGMEEFFAELTIVGNVANGIQLSPNEAAIQIKDEDRKYSYKISFSVAFCIIWSVTCVLFMYV